MRAPKPPASPWSTGALAQGMGTTGGFELPLMNLVVVIAVALAGGPGAIALDKRLRGGSPFGRTPHRRIGGHPRMATCTRHVDADRGGGIRLDRLTPSASCRKLGTTRGRRAHLTDQTCVMPPSTNSSMPMI